jgi:hypothetical protein
LTEISTTNSEEIKYDPSENQINPIFNNPIHLNKFLQDEVFFAGSHMAKYLQREKDMDIIYDSCLESNVKMLIADRNSDLNNPRYYFPEKYSI